MVLHVFASAYVPNDLQSEDLSESHSVTKVLKFYADVPHLKPRIHSCTKPGKRIRPTISVYTQKPKTSIQVVQLFY